MHMSSISYTQIMQWLPHEIKEKIVTNYKLATQDRLNLRLVDKNWKRIIDNSVIKKGGKISKLFGWPSMD